VYGFSSLRIANSHYIPVFFLYIRVSLFLHGNNGMVFHVLLISAAIRKQKKFNKEE